MYYLSPLNFKGIWCTQSPLSSLWLWLLLSCVRCLQVSYPLRFCVFKQQNETKHYHSARVDKMFSPNFWSFVYWRELRQRSWHSYSYSCLYWVFQIHNLWSINYHPFAHTDFNFCFSMKSYDIFPTSDFHPHENCWFLSFIVTFFIVFWLVCSCI